MDNYLAIPKNECMGGILVLHAWWGLNDFFKAFCDRLSAEGYLVLAPDLYHGATAQTIPEAEKLRGKLKREMVAQEILEALSQLQTHPLIANKPVGALGFSLGAYWTLWLAEEKPEALNTVILFYGTRGGEYTRTRAAFLGHFAETDPYTSLSGVRKLEKALKKAGRETAFNIFPGTGHWFCEDDRPEYNPEAASLAWQRTVEFLHAHL